MDALARLAAEPRQAAILLDIDGVLAPIVPRPEDARVPDDTRDVVRTLATRYPLVACISGRVGEDAARVVGVPELVYVGSHGLELDPDADVWRERLGAFLDEVRWPQTEDKGLTAGLHFRNVDDEAAARAELEQIASRAREAGFVARFGRKVLELLPPVDANKGTVIRRLLAERRLRRALYAGDDTTDIDAFAAVAELELGVRVAVASDEGPRALIEAADVIVDGPAAFLALLRKLL